MASLTETAYHTRKLIKWSTFLIIGFFAARLLAKGAGITWRKLNPPKPPEPTVAFGKLPVPNFPKRKNLPELSFKLETIEGKLPAITNVERIYFISKETYTYLTLERAQTKASAMGFGSEPQKIAEISETTYQWRSGTTIPSTLTMEITNHNFHLEYDYQKDQGLLNIKSLITPEQALTELKTFLKKTSFLSEDIKNGQANYIYYRYSPLNLVKVSSLSETDFIKVNLLRSPIKDIPVLPPNPYDANISGLISKTDRKRILDLKYTYFPIDKEVWATYPLKDSTLAWNELKNGQGFIANLGDNQSGEIIIRNAYLAYFDPNQHQNFLQPIFVFEGDHDFLAYVTAVSSQYIQ